MHSRLQQAHTAWLAARPGLALWFPGTSAVLLPCTQGSSARAVLLLVLAVRMAALPLRLR